MMRYIVWCVLVAGLCLAGASAAEKQESDAGDPLARFQQLQKQLDATRAEIEKKARFFTETSEEIKDLRVQEADLLTQMGEAAQEAVKALTADLANVDKALAEGEGHGWKPAHPDMQKLSDAKAALERKLALAESGTMAPGLSLDLGAGVRMKMVLIRPGSFTMGTPQVEVWRDEDEGPQHQVQITRAFYMGATEVTQEQYQAVMGANPSFLREPANPVETVSWADAQEFCRKASDFTGRKVRLPTEAEWEYACRAGTTSPFCFGSDARNLADWAWYDESSGGRAQPVAGRKPNAWGLYDMPGSVWEWCQDRYDAACYQVGAADDPQGPEAGDLRVLRGGSWASPAKYARCGERSGDTPGTRLSNSGFRVVVEARRRAK
jgi:formylglycine-generating enzyme required for sulfatase activity